MNGQVRYVYQVDGTRFSSVRFVSDDYVLQPNEREGWTDGPLPRLEDVPGFVPPVPPLQNAISRRQFFQAAALKDMITQEEAMDAMRGVIPPKMQEGIDTLPSDQKFAAEMMLVGANEFDRDHPLVGKFGEIMGMPPHVLDDMWRFAATL